MRIGLYHHIGSEESIDAIIDQFARALDADEFDLLVGPEYLFTNDGGLFEKAAKDGLVERLAELTLGKKAVLIPGTIVWGNPWEDFTIYANSAPLLYDGNVVGEVTKHSVRPADKTFANASMASYLIPEFHSEYLPSYFSERSFTIAGKRYLVEICDDHPFAINVMRTPLLSDIDVHVVVSNENNHHFTQPPDKLLLKEGGLFVECNGQHPSSYVGLLKGNTLVDLYVSALES